MVKLIIKLSPNVCIRAYNHVTIRHDLPNSFSVLLLNPTFRANSGIEEKKEEIVQNPRNSL